MKILCDSDFLIALFRRSDASHSKAVTIFQKVENEELLVTSLVLQEATTVISKCLGMSEARDFYDGVKRLIFRREIRLEKKVEDKTWRLFFKQTKKGTSFIDCANLAVFQELKLDKIASFDKFYPRESLLN